MRKSWSLVAILALLAVSACGSGGAQGDDPGAEGTSSTVEGENRSAPSGEGETLASFFGWDTGEDPEASQAEYREQEARIQEAIRQCMAEQGFEYHPVLPPESAFVDVAFDEEEYVRTHGFGITTWFGNEEEMGGIEEEWIDPNQEMLEAMSESEQTAWYEALYGTEEEQQEDMVTEVDPETGEEYQVSYGWGAGCSGEAYEAEYGDQQASDDMWRELEPLMQEMYERVQADPRIIRLDEEWSACMAERGYEYESMQAMQETVYQELDARFQEIVGPTGGFGDPFQDWTQEEIDAFFESATQEEIDALYEEANREARENVDLEAVAALQQEEIDLAVADFECRGDYYEVYQEVTEDYEAEFIEENRAALEEIREAQGG